MNEAVLLYVPHSVADRKGRKEPPQYDWWLEDDALLLHPEEAEQQEITSDGGEHGEQEQHVTRDA